jgi:hypothetical protein
MKLMTATAMATMEGTAMATDDATRKDMPKRRPPARSEIARIMYSETSVQVQGMFGPKQGKGYYFWAQAVGPDGRYDAGTSPAFPASKDGYLIASEDARDALNELIRSLWADGWNPTGFGRDWYQLNFRRAGAAS